MVYTKKTRNIFFNLKPQQTKTNQENKPKYIISQAENAWFINGKPQAKGTRPSRKQVTLKLKTLLAKSKVRGKYGLKRSKKGQWKRKLKLKGRFLNKVIHLKLLNTLRNFRRDKKGHQAPIFFNKSRPTTTLQLRNNALFLPKYSSVNHQFQLGLKERKQAILKYRKGLSLSKVQGLYIWALLQAKSTKLTLWDKFTLNHPKMALINKQKGWEKRQRNLGARINVSKRVGNSGFMLYKPGTFGTSRYRCGLSLIRYLLLKQRHKGAAWQRIGLQRTRRWKFKTLQSKLKFKTAQVIKLRRKAVAGRRWKKKLFRSFRIQYARNNTQPSLFLIRDFALRDKVREERVEIKRDKLNKRLQQLQYLLGQVSRKSAKRDTLLKILEVSNRLRILNKPLPWWKQKKVGGVNRDLNALAIFNKAFPQHNKPKHGKGNKGKSRPFNQAKRRLKFVRWFKLKNTRYNLYNTQLFWRGVDQQFELEQAYKRLTKKKNRKPVLKTSFFYKVRNKVNASAARLKTAQYLVGLKLGVAGIKPSPSTGISQIHELLVRKPTFFNLKKAQNAVDFNKFLKVNKVTAKVISEISTDLYTQYLTNLSEKDVAISTVTAVENVNNMQAARALRKYIKLLKAYFMEVYDNKLSKQIPASSSMHWVREYLRLTTGIKRRVSLWHRFNRVAFHFKPKAKEDEKRGRKKKILFKAKILFDRLFNWLYAQPNARYALAEPIQSGIVRDYIVRNQFIFKKRFKVKMPSKAI